MSTFECPNTGTNPGPRLNRPLGSSFCTKVPQFFSIFYQFLFTITIIIVLIIVIIAIIPLFTKLASKYMIAILLSIIIIQSFKIGIA